MHEPELLRRLRNQLSNEQLTVAIGYEGTISSTPSQPQSSGAPLAGATAALQKLGAASGVRVVMLTSQSRQSLAESLRFDTSGTALPFRRGTLNYRHRKGFHGRLHAIGWDGAQPDPSLSPGASWRLAPPEPSRGQRISDLKKDSRAPILFMGATPADVAGFEALRPGDTGIVVGEAITKALDERGLLDRGNLIYVRTQADAVKFLQAMTTPKIEGAEHLMMISNRLPISITEEDGEEKVVLSSGGLATGVYSMEPAPDKWMGTLQHGKSAIITLPNGTVAHALEMSPEEKKAFYDGFSNSVLWPLHHGLKERVPSKDDAEWWHRAETEWYDGYKGMNQKFADKAASLAPLNSQVWIHDYQMQLAPAQLRKARPDLTIGFFLHIPFPDYDTFSMIPHHEELIEGLLGNDVLGFHTTRDHDNFMTAVARCVKNAEARGERFTVNGEPVEFDAGTIRVGKRVVGRKIEQSQAIVEATVHPIAIDFDKYNELGQRPETAAYAADIRQVLDGRNVLAAIERLEYTKGLAERLAAIEVLLRDGKFDPRQNVYLQSLDNTRGGIEEYRNYAHDLKAHTNYLNEHYAVPAYDKVTGVRLLSPLTGEPMSHEPICDLQGKVDPPEVPAFYLAADAFVITPLRDGWNLMAEEFVASRSDLRGALVLGEGAGVVEKLGRAGALVVDPRDAEGTANSIHIAMTMAEAEQASRMGSLRRAVRTRQIHSFGAEFQIEMDLASARRADAATHGRKATRKALNLGGATARTPQDLVVDGLRNAVRKPRAHASRSSGLTGR